MKLKIFLRPTLTIVFGFLGAYIARSGTPPTIFALTGDYFVFVAFLAFGILGFILPDIVELSGKAGIAALAKQIAEMIPNPSTSRLSMPKISLKRKEKAEKYVNPMVLDTSALIDGRIGEVASIGFLYGTFLVIPSVISELKALADSPDDNKRARGRRGLDALRSLQKVKKLKVIILSSEPGEPEVDEKLLKVAKKVKGRLVTVDFNLNKVGKLKGIAVLNVHELSKVVKAPVLPNEKLIIKIDTLGKGKGQGVGYLEDGTMVIVEDGAKMVGKRVNVNVHRVLQTEAGQMIFARSAKLANDKDS